MHEPTFLGTCFQKIILGNDRQTLCPILSETSSSITATRSQWPGRSGYLIVEGAHAGINLRPHHRQPGVPTAGPRCAGRLVADTTGIPSTPKLHAQAREAHGCGSTASDTPWCRGPACPPNRSLGSSSDGERQRAQCRRAMAPLRATSIPLGRSGGWFGASKTEADAYLSLAAEFRMLLRKRAHLGDEAGIYCPDVGMDVRIRFLARREQWAPIIPFDTVMPSRDQTIFDL